MLALTRRGHGPTDQVQSGHALADAAEDARRLLDYLFIDRRDDVLAAMREFLTSPSSRIQ